MCAVVLMPAARAPYSRQLLKWRPNKGPPLSPVQNHWTRFGYDGRDDSGLKPNAAPRRTETDGCEAA